MPGQQQQDADDSLYRAVIRILLLLARQAKSTPSVSLFSRSQASEINLKHVWQVTRIREVSPGNVLNLTLTILCYLCFVYEHSRGPPAKSGQPREAAITRPGAHQDINLNYIFNIWSYLGLPGPGNLPVSRIRNSEQTKLALSALISFAKTGNPDRSSGGIGFPKGNRNWQELANWSPVVFNPMCSKGKQSLFFSGKPELTHKPIFSLNWSSQTWPNRQGWTWASEGPPEQGGLLKATRTHTPTHFNNSQHQNGS